MYRPPMHQCLHCTTTEILPSAFQHYMQKIRQLESYFQRETRGGSIASWVERSHNIERIPCLLTVTLSLKFCPNMKPSAEPESGCFSAGL